MKKIITKIALVVFAAAFVVLGVVYGPELYARLYEDNGIWISEKFTEEMKKTAELKVFQDTQTGMKTYTRGFELFGKRVETRKLEIPYTFYMDYTVDLRNASVAVEGEKISISVPSPKVNACTVTFADEDIKQSGLASLLSTSEISRLMNDVRDQLYEENADKQEYLDQAWEGTQEALSNLFDSVMNSDAFEKDYIIVVVRDDTLGATETPAADPTAQP